MTHTNMHDLDTLMNLMIYILINLMIYTLMNKIMYGICSSGRKRVAVIS